MMCRYAFGFGNAREHWKYRVERAEAYPLPLEERNRIFNEIQLDNNIDTTLYCLQYFDELGEPF
jgi:hypothetical protein